MRSLSSALLSSVAVAVAVRVPLAVQHAHVMRCASPIMETAWAHATRDVDATRDEAPSVVDPKRRQAAGTVVPTAKAAPTPAPSPRATAPTILVQGGSLRTWAYGSPALQQVQVVLSSEGRPIDASIELWQGPGNVPCKMTVYVENGLLRPFSAVIATPRTNSGPRPSFGDNVNAKPGAVPSTVAIRNTGQIEFPFAATVFPNDVDRPSAECAAGPSDTIQGGALRTYPFEPMVDSVQVLLETDGRPLNARIEIIQGPNNNKQVVELYTEDGLSRPFFAVLETPGSGNVIRVVNTAAMEYPLSATLVPDSIGEEDMMGYPMDGSDVIGDATRVGRYG